METGKAIRLKSKGTLEIYEEFVSAVKKKKLPDRIDWDKEYHSQFG